MSLMGILQDSLVCGSEINYSPLVVGKLTLSEAQLVIGSNKYTPHHTHFHLIFSWEPPRSVKKRSTLSKSSKIVLRPVLFVIYTTTWWGGGGLRVCWYWSWSVVKTNSHYCRQWKTLTSILIDSKQHWHGRFGLN